LRRLAIVIAALVVLGAGAALLLAREPSGPFPSAAHLREHGFAAWPVDTVEEARRECADAEGWRLDGRATAIRFAAEVLGYPEPGAGEGYDDDDNHMRLLINTGGVRGLFLGSAVDVNRYGRCWYVTEGMPREDELTATLGFVYREGRPHLLLGHWEDVPVGFVGFGDWETEIDPGLRQIVTSPPVPTGVTGHVIHLQPDERGISEVVGARALGFVPAPPEGPPAEPLPVEDVVDDRSVCRTESAHRKSPEGVIRYLFSELEDLLRRVNGSPRYERTGFRHLGGDRWRVVVDDAVLIATIPEVAGRCYALVSLAPVAGDDPLRRLWIEPEAITFGVDWGGGDEAKLSFGTGYHTLAATLKELQEPVTFARRNEAQVPGAPAFARVVLYKDGRVVSAYQGLFEP
jgi:hypothetical protein